MALLSFMGEPNIKETTMYFIDKTNRASCARNSREADYRHLEKEARSNPDPAARQSAREAMASIRKESHEGHKVSMRQALINAHRSGDKQEIKDIHDYISKKKKYHNE